ncbi:MAG: branched-chain amino acid ABC transporter substrate-binding protein [Rhodobacteraceae bacterium]|nr:MAG: branched-chain amino acid ABC transporter substrate-binding protein [Paracoccaceae bacterium]
MFHRYFGFRLCLIRGWPALRDSRGLAASEGTGIVWGGGLLARWKSCLAALVSGTVWGAVWGVTLFAQPTLAQGMDVDISYLRQRVERAPVLSNLDPIPPDEGLAGAALGQSDNAGTGKFLGQEFTLSVFDLDATGGITPVSGPLSTPGDLIVIDAPAAAIVAFADQPQNAKRLIVNVRAQDVALRDGACRANVLHTIPSYAMRADALSQFLVYRRWTDLALIQGRRPADRAFGAAIRASASKFGLKIARTKDWIEDADLRRTASSEVPLFTQDLPRHDVLIVADETDDFARYLPYNTWLPRPIAGSEGIVPVAWSPAVESWGAAQLQQRFVASAGRAMGSVDFAAWAAIRAIGEATTRTNSPDAATLRAYMLSPAFELAGFKGRKLSFRGWNGQMRQPIHLVQPRAVVANAPLPGFLHQRTELDTLGLDKPESACTAFDAP